MLVTHHLTEELYECTQKALAHGQQMIILYVREGKETTEKGVHQKIDEVEAQLIHKLQEIGNQVYCIRPEDSLEEIIGR